jgi:hypothetical protein
VGGYGGFGARGGGRGREPGRGEELGVPGRVAGGVVVHPFVRDDLHGGQRDGAVAEVDDRDGHFDAFDVALDEGRVAVGEAADHGGGELLRGADHGGAQGGAASGGLDEEGEAESLHDAAEDGRGAEVVEGLLGERDGGGGVQADRAYDGLGGGLVEGDPARVGVGAHVRDVEQLQDRADRAVLAGASVQRDEDGVRPVGQDGRHEGGVGVTGFDVDARGPQHLAHPATGAQGHLPLVGEASCQHEHVAQIAHHFSSADRTLSHRTGVGGEWCAAGAFAAASGSAAGWALSP